MRIQSSLLGLLFVSATFFGQTKAAAPAPAAQAPAATAAASAQTTAPAAAAPVTPDRGKAYYHYGLGRMYEELVSSYGRSDYAEKAITEYKLALQYDPNNDYLDSQLAELYARTGQIRDAVLEAQQIISRDPKNLDARRLLGRIYLRSLGDLQAGTQSQQMLKLAIDQYKQIVALDPSSVEDHLLLGRLYRLNGQSPIAESEFKTALKLQPDSEEALTSLVYLYTEEHQYDRAVKVLDSVPDASRSGRLYAALGYSYEQQHDYKNAIAAYQRSVQLDPDNLDSVRGLAQNLLNDGQTAQALKQYETIAHEDPQDAQAQLRLSELYRSSGNFDQALEALKAANDLVPDSVEVPYNTALVYEAQGRYADAATTLEGLVKKTEKPDGNYSDGEKNNRAIFIERLGVTYREQNNYPQAIATFRQLLPLGDAAAERGYDQMVETYRNEKQWNQALATAQEGVAKLPNDRDLKLTLAQQLADSGKGAQGIALLQSMLQTNPAATTTAAASDSSATQDAASPERVGNREVYLALAQLQAGLRHFPEAEAAAVQAKKLSTKSEDSEFADYVYGSVFEHEKKYDAAEQEFKNALSVNPHDAGVLNYLGYMLADRGTRLEDALKYVQQAVQLDPQNPAYLDSLGWAYFKMGNYELAEANLLKAEDKMGDDGTIQDHVASLYFKTGRLKQAAEHWQRALSNWAQTAPDEVDSNDVARVQKELESTRVRIAQQQSHQ